MNLENVNKAITIMERVKARDAKFNMAVWQEKLEEDVRFETEAELVECDTGACFAGWVAVSPEFQADGGKVGRGSGAPEIVGLERTLEKEEAIAYWLSISVTSAMVLCGLGIRGKMLYNTEDVREVNTDDVLAALCRLRDTGSL